jgi:hypothetical protein
MAATTSGEPEQVLPGGPVTIARIAELAGVSVPTVSKVVNGRAQVAPETRERVEAVIRRRVCGAGRAWPCGALSVDDSRRGPAPLVTSGGDRRVVVLLAPS